MKNEHDRMTGEQKKDEKEKEGMEELTARETLIDLIETLLINLEELKEAKAEDADRFAYGEKTAYVECLEIVQQWMEAVGHGLDFEVEKRYKL